MFGCLLHLRVSVLPVPLYFLLHRLVAYLPILTHYLQRLQLYVRYRIPQIVCQNFTVLAYVPVRTVLQRFLYYHQYLLPNQITRVVLQLLDLRQNFAVAFIRTVLLYDLDDRQSRLVSDCLHLVLNETAEKLYYRLGYLLLLQHYPPQYLYYLTLQPPRTAAFKLGFEWLEKPAFLLLVRQVL